MDNIIGMFEEKLRETTHEAHTSLESWLFLYSWEMVSCLGEIKNTSDCGAASRVPLSSLHVRSPQHWRWQMGLGSFIYRCRGFFIILDFDFHSLDFLFLPPFSFSLCIFLGSFSLSPFHSFLLSCPSAVHQWHWEALLSTGSLWRPWVWPLVSSNVNIIQLHTFPQESKQNKPIFSELILYYCTIISLMMGANFPCSLYSWHVICYAQGKLSHGFHPDCERDEHGLHEKHVWNLI